MGLANVARVEPDRFVFVGELWGVTVADGDGERFVEVSPAVLGVCDGIGLVTTDDRGELEHGIVHRNPGGPAQALLSVWYHRPRRSGRWWYHETPRATVRFDGEGPDGLPFAYIQSSGSVVCGVEDFICN